MCLGACPGGDGVHNQLHQIEGGQGQAALQDDQGDACQGPAWGALPDQTDGLFETKGIVCYSFSHSFDDEVLNNMPLGSGFC